MSRSTRQALTDLTEKIMYHIVTKTPVNAVAQSDDYLTTMIRRTISTSLPHMKVHQLIAMDEWKTPRHGQYD